MAAPLRYPIFRRLWLASLMCNLGLMINGVGAGWAMTELSANATLIALVQTATMLPVLVFAVPAGALVDMSDWRNVAIPALLLALIGTGGLCVLTLLGFLSPLWLLLLNFVTGTGAAIFAAAWQSSINVQVPTSARPSAIALNSISYNAGRSIGPAAGGFVVAAGGVVAAFAASAFLYLPMIAAAFFTPKSSEPPRLPPERLGGAIVSGVRYVFHSPPIRKIILRACQLGLIGGSVLALMPLISRDLLHGDSRTFGALLGSFGVGAMSGAFTVRALRLRFGYNATIIFSIAALAVSITIVAFSRDEMVTGAALLVAGAGWMSANTLFNIGVQLSVPRWVAGRALACFQACAAGGMAIGGWGWGAITERYGAEASLLAAALCLFALIFQSLRSTLREPVEGDAPGDLLPDPDVRLALTHRSGPIVIEIEYCVPLEEARSFYNVMLEVQLTRQRTGGYGWSVARDLADPQAWIERYHCPSWLDYLRQRNRSTVAERALQEKAQRFQADGCAIKVRRLLERPFGSVRWQENTPDPDRAHLLPSDPGAAGV